MKKVMLFFIALSPFLANAGDIQNLFGEGVFNTRWGQSLSEVKSAHAKVETKKYGSIVHLELKDGRSVFDIERRNKDKIVFSFDSAGRLSSTGVYFKGDKFDDLLSKLNTLFGPHKNMDSSFAVIAEWPIDNGLKISLTYIASGISGEAIFTLENQKRSKPNISKQQLGF